MLKQNDCLLAVNNHPKSKKPFNAFWQLRYLPAKCSPFAKSGKSFPDRTNNICCSQRNNKRGNYGNFEIKIKFLIIFRVIYFDFLYFEILRGNPVEINAETLQVCYSIPPPCIEKRPFS